MSGPERCALSALLLLLLVSAHGLVQRVHLVDVGPHDVIASWLAPLQVIGSPFAGIFQDVVGRCHLGKLAVSIWIFADVLHSVRMLWQLHACMHSHQQLLQLQHQSLLEPVAAQASCAPVQGSGGYRWIWRRPIPDGSGQPSA